MKSGCSAFLPIGGIPATENESCDWLRMLFRMLESKSVAAAITAAAKAEVEVLVLFCKIIESSCNIADLIFSSLTVVTRFLTMSSAHLPKLKQLSTQTSASSFRIWSTVLIYAAAFARRCCHFTRNLSFLREYFG